MGVQGDTLNILRGDVSQVEAARVIEATGHVVSRIHRHALSRRHDYPQGAPTRAQGPPGHNNGAHRHRRQLRGALQDAGGPAPLHRAGLRPQRRSPDARPVVQRGRVPFQIRQQSVGQHRLHPGQLPRPHLVRGLERPSGHGGGARGHEGRGPRGHGGGRLRAFDGPGLPPGAYADTDELVELSKVAAAMGGFYHTHTRAGLRKQECWPRGKRHWR